MFLNENNVVKNGAELIFTNRFAYMEYRELMSKVMNNMLRDLSEITGLEQKDIFDDYVLLNEYSPFKEILKREDKYIEDKSLVLYTMEQITK